MKDYWQALSRCVYGRELRKGIVTGRESEVSSGKEDRRRRDWLKSLSSAGLCNSKREVSLQRKAEAGRKKYQGLLLNGPKGRGETKERR